MHASQRGTVALLFVAHARMHWINWRHMHVIGAGGRKTNTPVAAILGALLLARLARVEQLAGWVRHVLVPHKCDGAINLQQRGAMYTESHMDEACAV